MGARAESLRHLAAGPCDVKRRSEIRPGTRAGALRGGGQSPATRPADEAADPRRQNMLMSRAADFRYDSTACAYSIKHSGEVIWVKRDWGV